MKLSNYVIVFISIAACMILISFMNIDIAQKANTTNIEYANKLTSACYDAAKTMNSENIDRYGKVWNDADDLNETLTVFYNSLVYSFDWDNEGRVDEMSIYTPVVCMIDYDGYYISHNVVFNTTGTVTIPSDADKRNGLTSLNTWTKSYSGVLLRYYLNDNVEVYCLDGSVYSGNRIDVYKDILTDKPGSTEASVLDFIADDEKFNSEKNELIVREINEQCEYYINQHNILGSNDDYTYTFEMPEIEGEDWNRLLQNPTVISFLQGYSSSADNKLLNVYALGGGELITPYHYFIYDDEYHCIEMESDVTKDVDTVETVIVSGGEEISLYTDYVTYKYKGHTIDTIYTSQTECAKRGAVPDKCIYNNGNY